jgi:hypothetical protein
MRIILKLFAAPFVLALTLLVAALSFCVSIATWAFGILSSICAICGLFDLFRGDVDAGPVRSVRIHIAGQNARTGPQIEDFLPVYAKAAFNDFCVKYIRIDIPVLRVIL